MGIQQGFDIISRRLINQQIATSVFKQPAELVQWMVAMQAQEYAWAKWAIGLRLQGSSDQVIEQAFNNGEILRTHLMRPTWHFVSPQDIRWLLALTAPQVHALNAYYHRKFGLDKKIFTRCNNIFGSLLEGRKQLTRSGIQQELQKKKIHADGLQLAYLLMNAELEGIICSGSRQGKQFTYALLDELVPADKSFDRREALLCFAKRYFLSRGPATAKDFSYWSGISMKEIKQVIEGLPDTFIKEKIGGQEFIYQESDIGLNKKMQTSFLFPPYDEYGMSYKDRNIYVKKTSGLKTPDKPLYDQPLIINGFAGGSWRKVMNGKKPSIETDILPAFNTKANQRAIKKAVEKYLLFNGH